MPYYEEEDVERLFYGDSREKKRTGYGVHNRASRKRGFKGSIVFPSDYLTAKQKKELSGKVVAYSMWEQILPREEFNQLDEADKKVALQHWADHYKASEIYKGIGCSTSTYYTMLKRYKIETPRSEIMRGAAKKRLENQSKQPKEEAIVTVEPPTPSLWELQQAFLASQEQEGFNINLKFTLPGTDIVKRIEGISLLLNNSNRYEIVFKVKEIVSE